MYLSLFTPPTKLGLSRGEGAAAVDSQRAGGDAEGAGGCQGGCESHQDESQQAAAHHWGPPGPAVQRLGPQGQQPFSPPATPLTLVYDNA